MKKLQPLLFLSLLCGSAHAQFIVHDPISLARQVAEMGQQLATMNRMLEQGRSQYESLTGRRGLGGILNNPMLRNALPPEYASVYRMASHSNYGISGSLSDIAAAERLTGSMADMIEAVTGRERTNARTNKAVGLKAYDAAQARADQIDALMGQIDSTTDPKAIAELQARIAIDQAHMQNEQSKLALIAMMQNADERLATQQRIEAGRKGFSSENQAMAGFD